MRRSRYKAGTRGSKLALAQTQQTIDLLRSLVPEAEFRIEIIASGAEELDQARASETGKKGPLTTDLERALLEGRIDIAVHSAKDLPTETTSGLTVAAYTTRLDPRDALVCQHGETLDELPRGGVVGTGSPRRRHQLAHLRSDLHFVDLRGNVDTLVRKVRHGEYQAVVLAYAGLIRVGLAERASQILPLDMVLPAAGQGALALECRHDDMHCFRLLELANHEPSALTVLAERAVLKYLKVGCAWPIGVSASFPDGTSGDRQRRMALRAVLFDPGTGRRATGQSTGPADEWHHLALKVAEQLGEKVGKSPARLDPSTLKDSAGK